MVSRLLGSRMTEQETIAELQVKIQELESKLKHATVKAANLEKQNKEFKLTIKDMDRRIMRGLKD